LALAMLKLCLSSLRRGKEEIEMRNEELGMRREELGMGGVGIIILSIFPLF